MRTRCAGVQVSQLAHRKAWLDQLRRGLWRASSRRESAGRTCTLLRTASYSRAWQRPDWLSAYRARRPRHAPLLTVNGGCGVCNRGDVDDMLAADVAAVFMPHGLGHMLGLDTHDCGGYPEGSKRSERPGYCSLRCVRVMRAGMIVTVRDCVSLNRDNLFHTSALRGRVPLCVCLCVCGMLSGGTGRLLQPLPPGEGLRQPEQS